MAAKKNPFAKPGKGEKPPTKTKSTKGKKPC